MTDEFTGRVAYCRNCGDPYDDAAVAAATDQRAMFRTWRPCPHPSPGRPMVDCGVGGHMYTDTSPAVD